MEAPCALVASCCSDYSPEELIKDILHVDDLPEGDNVIEDIVAYPWHLDTKYYSADICLNACNTRTIGDQNLAESVEAFLLYFDTNQSSSFEEVKSWLPYIREFEPEIKLLVCQQSADCHEVSRKHVQIWCIKNGFELVELSPEEDDNSDQEDDFEDSYGIDRIIQALRSHTWSNLVMKERPEIHSIYFQQLMKEAKSDQTSSETSDLSERLPVEAELCSEHTPSEAVVTSSQHPPSAESSSGSAAVTACELTPSVASQNAAVTSCQHPPSATEEQPGNTTSKEDLIGGLLNHGDQALFDGLESEDPEDDSFEKLFSRLHHMKDAAEKLPWSQRKTYAEEVTKLFWRSMGGTEDEIANLSDSD